VVSLSMSPVDDTFISASLDRTVRIWDLKSTACQGLVHRSGRMAASYDPTGIIFVVLSATNTISLYDKRNFDVGPFKTWQLDYPAFEWKTVEFSYNGNQLLLLTTNGLVFIVDAISGELLHELRPHTDPNDHILTVNFTPNSQYVFGGSATKLYAWNSTGGKEFNTWEVSKSVTALKWNPKYFMMATGDTNLSMWLPHLQE